MVSTAVKPAATSTTTEAQVSTRADRLPMKAPAMTMAMAPSARISSGTMNGTCWARSAGVIDTGVVISRAYLNEAWNSSTRAPAEAAVWSNTSEG